MSKYNYFDDEIEEENEKRTNKKSTKVKIDLSPVINKLKKIEATAVEEAEEDVAVIDKFPLLRHEVIKGLWIFGIILLIIIAPHVVPYRYDQIITVNGKRVNIPSYMVKAGDVIAVSEKSCSNNRFKKLKEDDAFVATPKWLDRDKNTLTGKVIALPARDDIDFEIAEHLIVELYSK